MKKQISIYPETKTQDISEARKFDSPKSAEELYHNEGPHSAQRPPQG